MTTVVPLPDPIPMRVVRWQCPACSRSANRPGRARVHIARCWYIPQNRGCKTCRLFFQDQGDGDFCDAGVDLSGRSECFRCAGVGYTGDDVCSDCDNNPELRDALKAGPIIHCDLWQARDEED